MKTIKQTTFDKKVREGRVEVFCELFENDHYIGYEIKGKNGKTDILRVEKNK